MFTVDFDQGFARYPIPGMAHIDYWSDPDIHLDIFQKMMGIGGPRSQVTGSRWWGKEWLMDFGDRTAYLVGRLITLATMLFFLIRLLEPLRPKLRPMVGWLCDLPGFVCGGSMPDGIGGWLAMLAWVFVPVGILKVWVNLELQADTHGRFGEVVRSILLCAWLVLLAVALPEFKSTPGPNCCHETSIKDVLGYATGLVVAALAWQLHTTVHKGIVQLWRYTGGDETRSPAPSRAVGPAPAQGLRS
jgi:hypothetical protein